MPTEGFNLANIEAFVGRELGVSGWVTMNQQRIDQFAEPTSIAETFLGIGYSRDRAGLPLDAIRVPVPRPAADQALMRVAASSLNPLEYKLADLNFLGRTPPVVLGFDLSGIVVAVGSAVRAIAVGDAVIAMADLNADGGWAAASGARPMAAMRSRGSFLRFANRNP